MRSLKNLCRISPSKMPHLPFQLRPGKHFPLMSNSQLSVRGSAWCLEMTQISVFSVMGFFEESGLRGLERRCEGNVCQGRMAEACVRPGITEGSFTPVHREACFPPWSNTMTSLFQLQEIQSASLSHSNSLRSNSNIPPLLSPGG